MPTYEIKCQICSEIIGTITKPALTSEDIETYRLMASCSNPHESTIELVEE